MVLKIFTHVFLWHIDAFLFCFLLLSALKSLIHLERSSKEKCISYLKYFTTYLKKKFLAQNLLLDQRFDSKRIFLTSSI